MSLFSRALLSSARVNFQLSTSQRLCRPFTTSTLRLRNYDRSPRVGRRQQSPYDQNDQYNQYEQEYYEPSPPRFNSDGTIVVGTIVGSCITVFAYKSYMQAEMDVHYNLKAQQGLKQLRKHFVMSWESIQNGRYYTILTSTFMHHGLAHLAFNMVALWSFGKTVVNSFGVPTFAALYIGSAITGGLFQYCIWHKDRDYHGAAVGASGAVFGILAALTGVMPRSSIRLMFVPMPMWVGTGISVVASIAGLQGVWGQNIGHADHLGGMAFGAVFWLLWIRTRRGRFMPYYP